MTQAEFFKRYQFDIETDELGEGGFGTVYKAFDDDRDLYVAIKVSQVKTKQENISLLKEYELGKSLPSHKHIAHYDACYRYRMPNGTFDYAVLQYYPDGNLSQLISSHTLSLKQKVQIANGIIHGINHLHNHDIVHRDLKSSNILISKRGSGEYVPKIADFGLSKLFTAADKSYFSNSFVGGSLLYVAPEQLSGGAIRKNVDIWSLGVILFELFTGNVPFLPDSGSSTETARAEIVQKINHGVLPDNISSIPNPWQRVIINCLVPNPDKRIKSINEILRLIQNAANNPDNSQDLTPPNLRSKKTALTQTNIDDRREKINIKSHKSKYEELFEGDNKETNKTYTYVMLGILVICLAAVINKWRNDSIKKDDPVKAELHLNPITNGNTSNMDGNNTKLNKEELIMGKIPTENISKVSMIGKNEKKFGDLIWQTKNLENSNFRNGDKIEQAKTFREWAHAFSNNLPAWCYYNYVGENGVKYGKLYNWYAVSDKRNLAPEGWHISTTNEWEQLIDLYGGVQAAGSMLKSDKYWRNLAKEVSGFDALPGGYIDTQSSSEGKTGYWWTSNQTNEWNASSVKLSYKNNEVQFVNNPHYCGFYIRCVKDY